MGDGAGSGTVAGDVAVGGRGEVAEKGEVEEEGGEEAERGLSKGAADGGEADEGGAVSGAHGHAFQGGFEGDGEGGGGGQVLEGEAVEPVEALEEAGGAAAETAVAVEVAGVAWEGRHGGGYGSGVE